MVNTHFLFLYQALQRQANLVAHSEGITVDGEVFICPQLLEIEADGAVCPAGERDVLAIEEARISPKESLFHLFRIQKALIIVRG